MKPSTRQRSTHRIQASKPTTADWWWLGVAIVLTFAVRVPFLDVPMIADEGHYALVTRGWLEGTGELYHDLWISRPQGIVVLYGAIFETLGTDVVAFRLAAAIAAAATAVVVWLYTRRWADGRTANLATVIFALAAASPYHEGFTANAEIFMSLPAAIAALVLLQSARAGWSTRGLVLTGVLIGIATLLKPSGIVMLPVAWAFIYLDVERPRRAQHRRSAAVLAGVVIAASPSLIHGIIIGWDEYLYATVTYRLTSQSSATVGWDHHLRALLGTIGRTWSFLALIGVVLLVRHRRVVRLWMQRRLWRRRFSPSVQIGLTPPYPAPGPFFRLARPDDDAGFLLRLWFLGCGLGIGMGGDWWTHYLIQAAAPFAIWLAVALPRTARTLRRADKVLLTLAVLGLLVWPFWVVVRGSGEAVAGELFDHPGYPVQDDVAAYLAAHTAPGDKIYVAFDQAAIYYLSGRAPAYRHLYDQELRAVPGAYSDLVALIHSPDRPIYIVGTRQPGPFPDDSRTFWREVGQFYDLETMVEGVPIYRARG
ncbi:MAG: glycosyltransferase family 39 protein [Chloroflexota bacterium]|nr:glycosyltransferase family 39 protein [Chloroflexota bacterium]